MTTKLVILIRSLVEKQRSQNKWFLFKSSNENKIFHKINIPLYCSNNKLKNIDKI